MNDPNTPVRTDVRPDGVAVLTLDQPDSKVNLLTPAMWSALEDALVRVADDPDVRGVVIASGKPDSFVAGADLKFLAMVAGQNEPGVRDMLEQGQKVLDMLESLTVPTCAVVRGPALGGGLELALACDHIMVDDPATATFGFPEVTFGLIPGWGGTQRLPRLIGLEKACEMLLTGATLSGDDWFETGLARSEVTAGDVIDQAAALTTTTTPVAVRSWKREPISEHDRAGYKPPVPAEPDAAREAMLCVVRGASLPLADALAIETAAFLRLAGSDESKAKIAAFFAEK